MNPISGRPRDTLDALVTAIACDPSGLVSCRRLRVLSATADSDLALLVPDWVIGLGHRPRDSYKPTFRGLLESGMGAGVRRRFNRIHEHLRARFHADPDFQYFDWAELTTSLGLSSEDFPLINAILVATRLFSGANGSYSKTDGVHAFSWGCPDDMEIIVSQTANALMESLLMPSDQPSDAPPTAPADYDVSLSFAGEDRPYVDQVAAGLRAAGVKIFYDAYEEAELWGKDLYSHLDSIYRQRSRYCVLFVSKHYAAKLWTNHDRKSAQARAFNESREYLLPARFDDTEIPGIPETIGFVDLRRRAPRELVSLVLRKLEPGSSTRETESSARTHDRQPLQFQVMEIVSRLQDRARPLAPVIAEVLSFAAAKNLSDLRELCENELKGYPRPVDGTPVQPKDSVVAHRAITCYASFGAEINLDHFGSGSAAIAYMEAHPADFMPLRILLPKAVAELEEDADNSTPDKLLSIRFTAGSLVPGFNAPDTPVFCYAKGTTLRHVLDGLRTLLTTMLLEYVNDCTA